MEAFDVDDPVIKDDDDTDEGVIDLPGGPDDELDLDYLISKLDLANELQNMQGMSFTIAFTPFYCCIHPFPEASLDAIASGSDCAAGKSDFGAFYHMSAHLIKPNI